MRGAALAIALGVCGVLACGHGEDTSGFSPESDAGDAGGVCTAGVSQSCFCPDGEMGKQTCTSSGWSGCVCMLSDGNMGDGPCGDGVCNSNETCESCPVDCGQCMACSLAPSCTNGASLPATLTPLDTLDCTDTDGGSPRCGVGVDAGPPIEDTDCLAPQLKIGLADIRVNLNGVGGSLDMFCMVIADDGHTAELIITPEEMGISDHAAPILLPTAQATFWGQDTGTPKLSQFPLTISYQCFEVDSPSTWQDVLGAIAMSAGQVASVPGNPYGWVFGAASAGAAAAQAGLAAGNGSYLRMNYQQTIDPSVFLEMTNGKTWTVEQSGQANGHTWDWALDVQSWGCSDARQGAH